MAYEWTPERVKRWSKTMRLYGLSRDGVSAVRKALIIAQKYQCALCGKSFSGGRIGYLDHDHHSGAIRGVLCMWCNRFRVAKNTRETSIEVVRYLSDPPAHEFMDEILKGLEEPEPERRESC
jgi:hypothetical protein